MENWNVKWAIRTLCVHRTFGSKWIQKKERKKEHTHVRAHTHDYIINLWEWNLHLMRMCAREVFDTHWKLWYHDSVVWAIPPTPMRLIQIKVHRVTTKEKLSIYALTHLRERKSNIILCMCDSKCDKERKIKRKIESQKSVSWEA